MNKYKFKVTDSWYLKKVIIISTSEEDCFEYLINKYHTEEHKPIFELKSITPIKAYIHWTS